MLTLTLVETILIVIWLFAVVTSYTFNGFIHIIIGVVILLMLSRLIGGKSNSGDGV